jgi:hypothetical protein
MLKLQQKLKEVESNIEINKVLDLAFEILSNPHYVRTN